ncbi:MAG: crossover junction endodeoxyribonuclease RuvC [Kiritimatiellae bacterium]|nr:crossover junction endodeoxyribonuclease RuvC [Kiritimatiellia bacterium]
MAREPLRILGIDTSLRSTGVGVVDARGTSFSSLYYGTIKIPRTWIHSKTLARLHEEITEVIQKEQPQAAVIEGIFYCKNVRTAMTLGQARGVVLAACATAGIPVFEYSPRKVKQAVVGFGSAHKDQIGKMIKSILGLQEIPQEDASDALALAICHLHTLTGHRLLDPQEI